MSIVILDESVASKIAAGEVIERPASVVKELIENALDAGSRRIEIEVREAGRGLIRVTDDGAGMTREDVVLSLQRHATSKIRAADDLFRITTLGFRGEALPSVASISHLTIVTRTTGTESGVRLSAVGGEVVELEEVGAPVGTDVSIGRLFYNTPARLKFLRRDASEIGQIGDTVVRFLFSHPQVSFRLQVEGREMLRHGASPDLRAAVQTLDPNLPLFSVRTLEDHTGAATFVNRLGGSMLGAFGGLALLLAAIGVYGVVSFGVSQRTREIGIRMALGASRRDIFRLVVGQGTRLALIGMSAGLALALGVTHFLEKVLFNVSARDPLTIAGVMVLLAAAALLACYLPARRATKVDPMVALRYE